MNPYSPTRELRRVRFLNAVAVFAAAFCIGFSFFFTLLYVGLR